MSPRAYKSEVSVPVINSCKFLSAVGELSSFRSLNLWHKRDEYVSVFVTLFSSV